MIAGRILIAISLCLGRRFSRQSANWSRIERQTSWAEFKSIFYFIFSLCKQKTHLSLSQPQQTSFCYGNPWIWCLFRCRRQLGFGHWLAQTSLRAPAVVLWVCCKLRRSISAANSPHTTWSLHAIRCCCCCSLFYCCCTQQKQQNDTKRLLPFTFGSFFFFFFLL